MLLLKKGQTLNFLIILPSPARVEYLEEKIYSWYFYVLFFSFRLPFFFFEDFVYCQVWKREKYFVPGFLSSNYPLPSPPLPTPPLSCTYIVVVEVEVGYGEGPVEHGGGQHGDKVLPQVQLVNPKDTVHLHFIYRLKLKS